MVLETGRRTLATTLAELCPLARESEIVIFAPFTADPSGMILTHFQRLIDNGCQIHWYGGSEAESTPCMTKLLCYPEKYKQPPDTIKEYLRYKIAKAFLGDETERINRRELQEAIIWLSATPDRIPEQDQLSVVVFSSLNYPAIESRSQKMANLKKQLRRVAASGLENVLILGETGTGKEATAFFLHDLDPVRRKRNFAAINCAGLREEFLISELFGHKKGAFTGAANDRPGLIAQLDGGTLFLDELPDMEPRAQAMLLRFAENGNYSPMGSDESRKADVKIIAGGQRELLRDKILSKEFRKDLYYRLAGKVLAIPSLREIPDDLPVLVDHLAYKMEKCQKKRNETIQYFSKRLDEMEKYSWPGNIRELANYVRRRLALGPDETISFEEDEFTGILAGDQLNTPHAKIVPDYAIEVKFSVIDKDMTIEDLKNETTKLEHPDDLKKRYIAYVHGLMKNRGVSNASITKKLGISTNTLTKCLS